MSVNKLYAVGKLIGMISVQVPTSLCMQNILIIHSRYCFLEQCVYLRESNIYMANLYLRDDQKWISFSLSRSLPLFFHPLSFLCPFCSQRVSFFSSQLSSFDSFVLSVYSRSRSAFSVLFSKFLAVCLELRTTVNLWITCPSSRPLS